MHPNDIWLLLDSRDLGGIESHVLQLSGGLRQAGLKPRVLFWADYGGHPLRAALDRAGLVHETLTGGFRSLIDALRRRRPAVLHTHGYKAGILGRLAARLTARPVVSTFHAGEPGTGKLRLYLDTGEWKQTILRILLFSEPDVDYPATLVRDHPDVRVVADRASATSPPPDVQGMR